MGEYNKLYKIYDILFKKYRKQVHTYIVDV